MSLCCFFRALHGPEGFRRQALLLQALAREGAGSYSSSSSSSSSSNSSSSFSSSQCSSSSSSSQGLWPSSLGTVMQWQQTRGYATKKGGRGATAGATPGAAAGPPKAVAADQYAPPAFKLRHVPRSSHLDPMTRLTEQQRELLQQLTPDGLPLRSMRKLGWPLGQREVLALMHEQLAAAANTNVQVLPFVLDSMYQSAASLASVVKEYLSEGKGMPAVEQYLLTTIANMAPSEIPFKGLKVQLKGRMAGKGGKASKRVWQWGRTSAARLADPVDYAHEAIITRAGYIGIKVWICYKRSHMQEQAQHSSRSSVSVPQLLSMPLVSALPSRSSSAWWNMPGPLQPQQHRAWECYKPGHDPLTRAAATQHSQQAPSPEQPPTVQDTA